MKKTITYKAKGLVLLGSGIIEPMVRFEADSMDELKAMVTDRFNNGKLDVLGYGGYKGVIVGVAQETSIQVEGDEFVNTKLYLEFVGDMTQKEMDNLQKYYFDYLVK